MRRPLIAAAAVVIVILSVGVARMREKSAQSPASPSAQPAVQQPDSAPPAARELDDPTIVAIFDMANTNDIETGTLAVQRGRARRCATSAR